MEDKTVPAAGVEENALDWLLARRDTCGWSRVSYPLLNRWEVAGLEASRAERACSQSITESGIELTAGVERSLLIAIVGAMVETGSGLRVKTRKICVPVDKKLALQVECTGAVRFGRMDDVGERSQSRNVEEPTNHRWLIIPGIAEAVPTSSSSKPSL